MRAKARTDEFTLSLEDGAAVTSALITAAKEFRPKAWARAAREHKEATQDFWVYPDPGSLEPGEPETLDALEAVGAAADMNHSRSGSFILAVGRALSAELVRHKPPAVVLLTERASQEHLPPDERSTGLMFATGWNLAVMARHMADGAEKIPARLLFSPLDILQALAFIAEEEKGQV